MKTQGESHLKRDPEPELCCQQAVTPRMDERALKLGRSRSDSPLQASRERGTCWHHGLDFQPLEQDPINSCYVKPVGYLYFVTALES